MDLELHLPPDMSAGRTYSGMLRLVGASLLVQVTAEGAAPRSRRARPGAGGIAAAGEAHGHDPEGDVSTVARNLRQIRSTTWTLADAAGLRLAVCPPPEHHDCDLRLGTVTRDVYVGETIRIPVRLRNRSGRGRRLVLTAGPVRAPRTASRRPRPPLDPGTLVLLETRDRLGDPGRRGHGGLPAGPGVHRRRDGVLKCCDPQELRVRLRVRPDGRAPTFDVCCAGADAPGPCGERRGRTAR